MTLRDNYCFIINPFHSWIGDSIVALQAREPGSPVKGVSLADRPRCPSMFIMISIIPL